MKSKQQSSKVNRAWIHDHINDPWVKLAQKEGYRARAAYKLKEIDESFRIFDRAQVVIDLGCTPGAWCQYVKKSLCDRVKKDQKHLATPLIIGVDLLAMTHLDGVNFIQGDFCDDGILEKINALLDNRQVDVVISDMAPNLSGIADVDHARMENLLEIAVDFAKTHLQDKGVMVAKVFHGKSYNTTFNLFKDTFQVVKVVKPGASRDRSAETYLVGMGL